MSYVNRWLIIKWNDELTGNFQANSILQLELTTIALEPEIFLNVFLSLSCIAHSHNVGDYVIFYSLLHGILFNIHYGF